MSIFFETLFFNVDSLVGHDSHKEVLHRHGKLYRAKQIYLRNRAHGAVHFCLVPHKVCFFDEKNGRDKHKRYYACRDEKLPSVPKRRCEKKQQFHHKNRIKPAVETALCILRSFANFSTVSPSPSTHGTDMPMPNTTQLIAVIVMNVIFICFEYCPASRHMISDRKKPIANNSP